MNSRWDLRGTKGGNLFPPLIARARCNVNDPWPVPASNISSGSLVFSPVFDGDGTWISKSETRRFASAAYT